MAVFVLSASRRARGRRRAVQGWADGLHGVLVALDAGSRLGGGCYALDDLADLLLELAELFHLRIIDGRDEDQTCLAVSLRPDRLGSKVRCTYRPSGRSGWCRSSRRRSTVTGEGCLERQEHLRRQTNCYVQLGVVMVSGKLALPHRVWISNSNQPAKRFVCTVTTSPVATPTLREATEGAAGLAQTGSRDEEGHNN